jgi:hypothetical protein
MQIDAGSKVERIAELNDALRTTLQGGKVLITATVSALPGATKLAVIQAIRGFADFSEDNNPYGERDFVSVVVDGDTYFGKIDCYAPDMEHGSEDPSDPKQTVRVLTIMHSSDY